jgi:hypothetical protein
LVGPDDATGLGSISRDLVAHGLIDRWLITRTAADDRGDPARRARHRAAKCRVEVAPGNLGAASLRAWVHGLDWVVFAESPAYPGLVWRAHEMDVAVACIPMWEWTHPDADWLSGIDLMICPTVHAFEQMLALKRRRQLSCELTHVPWPVDCDRFSFRQRGVCQRFLYVNGHGGCRGLLADGSSTPYRRKGLDVVLSAARLLPRVPFVIHSQVPLPVGLPVNVEARPAAAANERLYDDGDVCVQPSRWEGIGLSLLECQAAGLPLVTTDAAPMNELAPFRAVAADRVESVYLDGDHAVASHSVAPERLAEVLEPLVGTDVSAASRSARAFVECSHHWRNARRLLREAFCRIPIYR